MQASGGLKLTLAPPTRDDRLMRFAKVVLNGGGEETQFLVEESRWTTVRLALR
jgi:hypothetical protein